MAFAVISLIVVLLILIAICGARDTLNLKNNINDYNNESYRAAYKRFQRDKIFDQYTVFEHYKGSTYVVDYVAEYTELKENDPILYAHSDDISTLYFVIYHKEGSDKRYARPVSQFLGLVAVELNGEKFIAKRFKEIR